MIAIEIREPGEPDVLVPVERPTPAPATGEVLIKVAAAGVNRPDVFQRHLPGIHDRAVDHAVVSRRDFQHHWTGVLGVEERHQINHVGIRRERLVLPVRRSRPRSSRAGT